MAIYFDPTTGELTDNEVQAYKEETLQRLEKTPPEIKPVSKQSNSFQHSFNNSSDTEIYTAAIAVNCESVYLEAVKRMNTDSYIYSTAVSANCESVYLEAVKKMKTDSYIRILQNCVFRTIPTHPNRQKPRENTLKKGVKMSVFS